MAGEPRNAASERVRASYPRDYSRFPEMGPEELAQWRARYLEGFVREDRRKFVTLPTTTGPDELRSSMLAYWNLGAGPPTFSVPEIVAVRGDRSTLFRSRVDFEDDRSTEFLVVFSYSADMKAARAIMFDLDDLDAALTELDLLHAEITAENA